MDRIDELKLGMTAFEVKDGFADIFNAAVLVFAAVSGECDHLFAFEIE